MERRIRVGMVIHGSGGITSGVGKYVNRVMAGWPKGPTRLLVYGQTRQRAGLDPQGRGTWFGGGAWHGIAGLDLLWHHFVLPVLAAVHRLDVLFVAVERRCPLMAPCPVVVTVHDLAPLAVPGKYGFGSRLLFSRILPATLRRHRIIAVSRLTARDVMQRYHIVPSSIRVVRNGVDPIMKTGAPSAWIRALPRPYVIFPARLEHPGKNHVLAIGALARYLAMPGAVEIDLICPGAPWQGVEAIHAAVHAHGLADRVHFPGWISDEDLALLYTGARALIFPSRYEGFGLPLVEAMIRGLPIITTPCGAIPEVAGDAALYVGPDDEKGLAEGLQRILHDVKTRNALIQAGLVRAARFSWEKTVRQTLRFIGLAVK